jgi:mannosyl-oligosaccharide alpha-1,2-mannosidase
MRSGALIPTLAATALSLAPSVLGQLSAAEKADQVKEAFLFAWDGYYEYAFPHDELHPVSNTYGDSRCVQFFDPWRNIGHEPEAEYAVLVVRNGWGASAADALSTAIIMELPDVVDQILDHLSTVDFSSTTSSVSLFETTIRYLGGMLAGYDLLNDEALSHLASKVDNVTRRLSLPMLMPYVYSLNKWRISWNNRSGSPMSWNSRSTRHLVFLPITSISVKRQQ